MDDLHIEKVLHGDHQSFRYFISTYKEFAFSMAIAILKDGFEAEDAVQEAFVRAFRGLRSFRKQSSFKTWLGRIVINESLKKAKTRRTWDMFPEEMDPGIADPACDAIQLLALEQQREVVAHVLGQISPQESLVLELFYLQEHTLEEICELTGWSESRIKMLLHRGRKHFYHHLHRILKSELNELRVP